MSPEQKAMREQVLKLIQFAKMNVSAETVANNILDSVPDDELDKLEPLARDVNQVAAMILLAPEAEPFRAWLEAFRLTLVAGFDEMNAPDMETRLGVELPTPRDEMQQFGTPGEDH